MHSDSVLKKQILRRFDAK